MMVPQLTDAQMNRLRSAYNAGVEIQDIADRFGIGPKQVLQAARGRVPMIYDHGNAVNSIVDDEEYKQIHVKSCRLHFLDLVAAYRPEVLDKFNSHIQRRKAISKAAIDNARSVVEASKPVEPSAMELQVTKRSRRIFAAGLRHFSMTADEMTGKTRTDEYVKARQTLMFVIYSECVSHESTPSIGRMFNKDHSTVVHAVHKVRALLAQGDKTTSANVAALREVK